MATILLVDDCRSVRKACHCELETAGHYVLSARDGNMACRLLESKQVDLVILDIQMPQLCGPDTLAQLRVSHAELPVIFHTSESQTSEITEVLGPLVGYVRKSGRLDELTLAVAKVLATRCTQATLRGLSIPPVDSEPFVRTHALGRDSASPCPFISPVAAPDWNGPGKPR